MSGVVGAINTVAGGLNTVTRTIGAAGQVVSSAGTLANQVSNLFGGGNIFGSAAGMAGAVASPSSLGAWAANLQPASWNGVGFKVRQAGIRRGRRVVVHEYPFRDTVWIEDLGRGVRSLTFNGFLIGDDVYQQRQAMLAAVETPNAGQLVHPSLGSIQVSLIEFSCDERWELGRVVELQFVFIDAGTNQPLNPTTASSTQAATTTAAAQLTTAASSNFGSSVVSALQTGYQTVQAGLATATGFVNAAQAVVSDASRVVGAVTGLAGVVGGGANFGRYNAGNLTTTPNILAPVNQALSLAARTVSATSGVLSASVTLGTAVKTAATGFTNLVSAL
jgi:prophage DNA circulation protein